MTNRVFFGQVGRLKPEMIETYEQLHRNAWPGVKDMIKACHLENYSIFREGTLVFSYYEYTGDDLDMDMQKMESDPLTQEWWTHTHPCFETFSFGPDKEYVADMKQIFYLE